MDLSQPWAPRGRARSGVSTLLPRSARASGRPWLGRGDAGAFLPASRARAPIAWDAPAFEDEPDPDLVTLPRALLRPARRPGLSRRFARGAGRSVAAAATAASLLLAGSCSMLADRAPGPVATVAPPVQPARIAALPSLVEPAPRIGDAAPGRPEFPRLAAARLETAAPVQPPTKPGGPPNPFAAGPTTELVAFNAAPFPYQGTVPGTNANFLDVGDGSRRGHSRGRGVLWENETFADNRVLMHVPQGFTTEKPGVIVVYFHGHGATIERDVIARQQVPQQVSASGANAVLLAPQFAVDASDSSAGRFWEPGGFKRFLDEAAGRFAKLKGDPAAARKFARMPVIVVSYSGGFVPAAYALDVGGANNRVRGLVMLDSVYGEHEKFAEWINSGKGFFVNASTPYTRWQAEALAKRIAGRSIAAGTQLPGSIGRGSVTFLTTGADANHRDYMTQAWTEEPLRDLLSRLPEYRLREPDPPGSAKGLLSSLTGRSTVAAAR